MAKLNDHKYREFLLWTHESDGEKLGEAMKLLEELLVDAEEYANETYSEGYYDGETETEMKYHDPEGLVR